MVIECFSCFPRNFFWTNNFEFLIYTVSSNSKVLEIFRPANGNARRQLFTSIVIKKDNGNDKIGAPEKMKQANNNCPVSPALMTRKKDNSVKIAQNTKN